MTGFVKRPVESRFARRASIGRGIGLDEAVASAEARLESMGETARKEIAAMLNTLQQYRTGIGECDEAAMGEVWAQADSLAGVAGMFGMPEVGQAAGSLCQLFDAAAPAQPNAGAVGVHLDAFRIFQSLSPAAMTDAAPMVLSGLKDIVAVEHRRARALVASN